jgi:phosphatidylserine/phosphatidylglycerophosphate/cardiolipin synthase-like enzyme
MFLNVDRPKADTSSEAEILKRFADRFRDQQWPGKRTPTVYYDPRAVELHERGEKRASLHAKCVIVDDAKALVTSANFTEAAQERNIEAGVLVERPGFAVALRKQFDGLVAGGWLRRVPGIG